MPPMNSVIANSAQDRLAHVCSNAPKYDDREKLRADVVEAPNEANGAQG